MHFRQIHDTLETFLGKVEDGSEQKRFYAREVYKIYVDKNRSVEINGTRKALFGFYLTYKEVKSHLKHLMYKISQVL